MRISNILFEQHMNNSNKILLESCHGLDQEQRTVVEGIYHELRPLIEASLSPDQIKSIFGAVEKSATDAGGNRTMLGKGIDVGKKANEIVDNIGKWLQDTTPVKAFDQKFDQLKNKINTKFPDSKILDGISIGKGIKTAAYGFIAGKTFELLGDAIKGGAQVVKDTMFPNALRLNMNQIFDEVGGELGTRWANFEIKGLVGTPEDINTAKKLFSEAGQYWKAGDYEQSAATWKSLEGMIADTFNDKQYIAQIASDQASRTMISQAAQAAQEATKYLGAAAQGAVAGAGVKGSLTKKESIEQQVRPLSEGQVYLVFKRITESQLNEGPMDVIKGFAGKAMDKARTVGTNLTTKITADKLNSAWQKAGAPTDSEELKKFLTSQGVDTTAIDTVYKSLKISSAGTQDAGATLYAQVKADLAKLDKKSKRRLTAYLQKQLGTS